MNRTRLTISSSLQIYFDRDGQARYAPSERTLASVETELNEWQTFVERWLEKAQAPPAAHKPTPEEAEFVSALRNLARHVKRNLGLSPEQIREVVRQVAVNPLLAKRWPMISEARRHELAGEVESR